MRFGVTAALVWLVLCGTSSLAQPPSFDCRTNTAPDEQTICANQRLAELDRPMAFGFEYVRKKYGNLEARKIGRPLLQSRQACGANESCIEECQLKAIRVYISLGAPIKYPPIAHSHGHGVKVASPVAPTSYGGILDDNDTDARRALITMKAIGDLRYNIPAGMKNVRFRRRFVAIITKNEGMVWTKRKLFFDAKLNPRYGWKQQAIYS